MTPESVTTERFANEVDEWASALFPDRVAEQRATEPEKRLAAWARQVAVSAAYELLQPEGEAGSGRSSLVAW